MTENAASGPDDVTPDSTSVPPPAAATPPPPPASAATPPPPPAAAPAPPPPPASVAPGAGVALYPNGKPMLDAEGRPASPKSRLAAALLAWFLGFLGIHRFYVGKVGTGILMIVTLGGLGIWVLIDFIVILIGSFKDKEERYLANW
ncbi:MAG: TM2 domain-containing protein [Candidatus Nanopelagicales bacterium]